MQRLSLVSCLLLLVSCQPKGPDDKTVLAEGNKLAKPLPGLYRSTTSLVSFELPGADPQTADMIRDRFAQVLPQRREYCLTPEAAARGFQDMVRQSQQGDCRIDSFVADKSRLSARMSCRLAARLTSTVSVTGTGRPDSSHIDLEIVQTGPSVPGGSETMVMKVDNQRVGDCPR
jgi:hypothetical protein